MITCDRCQKQIIPNDDYPESRFKIIDGATGLVACYECNHKFLEGLSKIVVELKAQRDLRTNNWRNEWLRNFKPER